jgi:hypothetical protein
MPIHKLFTELTAMEQIDFFVQCQKLLVEFHPSSSFVCRRNNIDWRKYQIQAFLKNYKGMCYWDENVCVLYNRVVVSDPKDPIRVLKNNIYHPPDPNYNAIIIDFVVFRSLQDCQTFVHENYDSRVQHVLYVKNNKVKIYPVVNFLSQIFNLAVV